MADIDTPARFNLPLIALHWLTLIVLALAYATSELREVFPKGSAGREGMMNLHVMLGLIVFGIAWLRLLVRTFSATPAVRPAPPPWQETLAKLAHVALYGLTLLLPLTGWLMLSADGKPVDLLGWQLPDLITPNRSIADALEDVHEALASAGYALIGLHAAAALFHHYVLRDNALRLMLPTFRRVS
jgi:cytochrome b561